MTKQFLKYAVPSALAMFVSSLYTIIDGIFVGQGVGDSALAAVNVIMPFTIMLFGIATMFAVGGGALVSKYLGAKDGSSAIEVFRQVFKFLLILSVTISVTCVIFARPLAKVLGATENILNLASDYLRFYAMFCIPNLIGIALNSFVRNDGKPKLAMISTISGAVTNIILDYIFVFKLSLGIKGAAIATGLGQIVTVSILIPHFLLRKGALSFGNVKLNKVIIKEFSNIGIPSFFTEVTFSIIVFLMNIVIVRIIGDKGLSAFSVINYLTTNVYMVLLGVAFGVQPLISYNYGAKDKEKMIKFYNMTNVACLIVNIVFSGICFIFGKQIIGIFTSNIEIIEMTYVGLNLLNLGFFATGVNLASTIYYQAIEAPGKSNLICALRSIIVFPISLVILSFAFGEKGIWLSLLLSEGITAILMIFVSNIKKATEVSVNLLR